MSTLILMKISVSYPLSSFQKSPRNTMLNRTVLLASLVSGVIVVVQGQSTADDLPPCAALCAATAAVASGCLLYVHTPTFLLPSSLVQLNFCARNDAACLCAHPLFKNATLSCTGRSCTAQDNNSANDILTTMCANCEFIYSYYNGVLNSIKLTN